MTYLNDAIIKGDFDAVKNMIEKQNYSPNATGFLGYQDTPLVVAATYGQRKIMDYLIHKGADINLRGGSWFSLIKTCLSPIEAAFLNKQTQIVVTLLANNVTLPKGLDKTNVANEYLIKAARTNDTWSIDKILATTEADINTLEPNMLRSPLHNAVMYDNYDATFKLIEKGARINTTDSHGWTPLHYAASNSDSQFAQLLIDKGAKVNAQDNNEQTPIFAAVSSGEEALVNLLVSNGAKINLTNNDGRTPLDIVILNDDADMVRCLVANGAKISANYDNTTPLEYAAQLGKLQALEALIEVGSSINGHKNADGNTPVEIAFKANQMGAVNMLIMHGAEVPRYIQNKLDKMKAVDVDQVLPGEQVVTSETADQDNATVVSHTNHANIDLLQPIGPTMLLPADQDHAVVIM